MGDHNHTRYDPTSAQSRAYRAASRQRVAEAWHKIAKVLEDLETEWSKEDWAWDQVSNPGEWPLPADLGDFGSAVREAAYTIERNNDLLIQDPVIVTLTQDEATVFVAELVKSRREHNALDRLQLKIAQAMKDEN